MVLRRAPQSFQQHYHRLWSPLLLCHHPSPRWSTTTSPSAIRRDDHKGQEHNQHQYYPVIIVGGGPTGLLLSNLLSHYKIRSLLLESKTVQSSFQHPQAHFLNTRTLEILRCTLPVIYQRVVDAMPPVSEYESFYFGYSVMDQNPLAKVIHPVRYPLQVNQDANGRLVGEKETTSELDVATLERNALSPCRVGHLAQHTFSRILYEEALIAAPDDKTRLQFGSRVHRVECDTEDSTGRRLLVHTVNGPSFTTDVCIAADGASSTLRQAQRQGNYKEQYLINVHVKLPKAKASMIPNQFMLFTALNEHAISMIVSHGHGEYVLQIPYFPPYQDPQVDFSPNLLPKLLSAIFGFDILPDEIQSARPWTMTSWIASRYHNGKGLVWLGDAGHSFPPAGGFGMNTGLQDAHNLAWKLCSLFYNCDNNGDDNHAFVQKRNFWLDSFQEERRPVAMQNAALSVRNYNRVLNVMNECYLNHKHPEFIQKALDAMAPLVPLPSRQAVFRSLLATALQPLAWLGGSASTPPLSLAMYRTHVQSNLCRLLREGGGLPLLFPRFELGFGYRHHLNCYDSGDIHSNKQLQPDPSHEGRSFDTWGDAILETIRVGYRLPHAPLVPCFECKSNAIPWSTIDLPSIRLSKLATESSSTSCSWVILAVDTESMATANGLCLVPFWEDLRTYVQNKAGLLVHMVHLTGTLGNTGSWLENASGIPHYRFALEPHARAFVETKGVALVRPDGHVAAWIEGQAWTNKESLRQKVLDAILV